MKYGDIEPVTAGYVQVEINKKCLEYLQKLKSKEGGNMAGEKTKAELKAEAIAKKREAKAKAKAKAAPVAPSNVTPEDEAKLANLVAKAKNKPIETPPVEIFCVPCRRKVQVFKESGSVFLSNGRKKVGAKLGSNSIPCPTCGNSLVLPKL